MNESQPIDVTWLRKTFDDDTVLAELYAMYLSDTTKRLADLCEAVTAKDMDRCSRAAHSIKGSSSNVGATPMRELASKLEKHDWNADPGGAPSLAAQLEAEFARVQVWIQEFLATASAAH